MAKKKVIIEARVNEYMMRDENPNVPWTPDEIAAAAADVGSKRSGVWDHCEDRADLFDEHIPSSFTLVICVLSIALRRISNYQSPSPRRR